MTNLTYEPWSKKGSRWKSIWSLKRAAINERVFAIAFVYFLASLSLERLLTYKSKPNLISLLICWFSFTLACLIKVLPLLWLWLPLLFASTYQASSIESRPLNISLLKILINFFSRGPVLFLTITLFSLIAWYSYAYYIGITSVNSIGFWEAESDRGSI